MSVELTDIDDQDDLIQALQILNSRLDGIANNVDRLEDELHNLAGEVDDLDKDVTRTNAAVPEQSKTKLDNVVSIVKHAYDKDTGGTMGTKLPSGEVTAVISGSKQTGLRLMDEIGGKFAWADVENPGGPKPKQLKIKTAVDVDERIDEVVERYSE